MQYWLMKSEPDVFSIDDLARSREEIWDGVRNYQARNFLRQMAVGDRAFFYHSNTQPPGIAGWMTIATADIVDPSQFDPASPYYDPKADSADPRWRTVKVAYGGTFPHYLSLETLRQSFTPEELLLLRRGNRLSVMPVEAAIADRLWAMAHGDKPDPIEPD